MSSLVCNTTHCIFTRVDTNGTATYPIPVDPIPPFHSKSKNATVTSTFELFSENTTAPWTNLKNQDKLSDTVAITRDFRGYIFNALVAGDMNNGSAPFNTEWAMIPEGKTFQEARCSMTFCGWNDCFAHYSPEFNIIGKPGIVHLIQEDVYYNIMFTSWTADYPCSGGYCPPPIPYDQAKAPPVAAVASANTVVAAQAPTNASKISMPISYPPYPRPSSDNHPGGGFAYVRDAKPFKLKLAPCPNCRSAMADPAIILGPADNTFVNVTVSGVTPTNAVISIKAVGQGQQVKCNRVYVGNKAAAGQVLPNAMLTAGNSFVQLRRTLTPGELNPFTYTVYFDATTAGGTCSGQVFVCVPAIQGVDCNAYFGYDATATEYCLY